MARELIVLLYGFTVVAALILAIAYLFFLPAMRKTLGSKAACCLMLTILTLMQWFHYQAVVADFDALGSRFYLSLLMLAPPAFISSPVPSSTWIRPTGGSMHFISSG